MKEIKVEVKGVEALYRIDEEKQEVQLSLGDDCWKVTNVSPEAILKLAKKEAALEVAEEKKPESPIDLESVKPFVAPIVEE